MLPGDWQNEHNVIAFIVRQMIAKMDIMKLVKVVKVTPGEGDPPAGGTVDVLPLVMQIDGNGNGYPHTNVTGIPYSRIQGGTNAIVCDPVVGDLGYVVCADRDGTKAVSNRDQSVPGTRRRNSISDGVYAGAVMAVAPEQYLIFTDTGVRLVDKAGNVVNLTSDGLSLTPASGKPVTINGAAVVTGNLQLGGNILAQDGTEYAGSISILGTIAAANFIANPGPSAVTMLLHVHANNNIPPTPGH